MNTSETYNLNTQEKMLNHFFQTTQLRIHPNSFSLNNLRIKCKTAFV